MFLPLTPLQNVLCLLLSICIVQAVASVINSALYVVKARYSSNGKKDPAELLLNVNYFCFFTGLQTLSLCALGFYGTDSRLGTNTNLSFIRY